MDRVKVGVIGVGNMGQRHCRVYSSLPQARLVGVCDIAPEVGARIARQYGVPFYASVDRLLSHVDAVSIATPTALHYDLAMRCLARGVHVLIEKPITDSPEQAEALAQAAAASGLVVQAGHIERFNPTYLELKAVLKDVTILAINLRRLSAYAGSNTDVDVILDLMIHDLDLALDLLGQEPTAVDAYGLTAFSGAVDHAVAHLWVDAGPLVTITASRVTEQKIRAIEVTAAEAYLEGDLLNKTISVHRHTIGQYLSNHQRGVKYRQEGIIERIHVPMFEPLLLELEHFVECVLHRQPPRVPIGDAVKALRLAFLIRDAVGRRLIDLTRVRSPQYLAAQPVWAEALG
jgi:predicted dehydrogenase